jgi:hypothetical protein
MANLNGHGGEAASLDAALIQLNRDRDAVRTEIESLNQRRHRALLDDATDVVLDKIEREIDRATVKLEKLNISDAPLREKLSGVKSAAKKKAIDTHFELIAAAYERLRGSVLSAEAAQVGLMQARDAAVAEVGESSISTFPIFAYGGLLGHGSVQHWADECDRILAAARASRQPRPAATSKATELPYVVLAPKPRPVERIAPPSITAPVFENDVTPLGPGEVYVQALRRGYIGIDGHQCHAGRVTRALKEHALAAAGRGAVQIVASTDAGAK